MLVIGYNDCTRHRAVRSEAIMDSRKEDMCCLLQMAQYMFCSRVLIDLLGCATLCADFMLFCVI